jgi:uncharacterized protein (TIGR02246 family)
MKTTTSLTLAGLLLIAVGVPSAKAIKKAKAESLPNQAQTKGVGAVKAQSNANPQEKAIREAEQAFVKAFNAGDVKALSQLYVDDAEIVDEEGNVIRGRSAIAEQFAQSFEDDPKQKIAVEVRSVRFLTPDLAIEEGVSRITPGIEGPVEVGNYEVYYAKSNGAWLQLRVEEHEYADGSAEDRLKELAWMVGEWLEESSESVVQIVCKWSPDKKFLLRDYKVRMGGKQVASGEDRIGWDPSIGHFHSWTFNSEGGFGEGVWSKSADGWIIKRRDVLPNGDVSTATNIMKQAGHNQVHWSTLHRTLGGQALEDDEEMTLVKLPPEANAK